LGHASGRRSEKMQWRKSCLRRLRRKEKRKGKRDQTQVRGLANGTIKEGKKVGKKLGGEAPVTPKPGRATR